MICRKRWNSREKRQALLDLLRFPKEVKDCHRLSIEEVDSFRDPPFEEVKLILGLAWQRGRWDGSDGGVGGYREVLGNMATGVRYETEDEHSNSILLISDMKEKFHLIASQQAMQEMNGLDYSSTPDIDAVRRKCAALVLAEMKFVEKGL